VNSAGLDGEMIPHPALLEVLIAIGSSSAINAYKSFMLADHFNASRSQLHILLRVEVVP